MYRNDSLLSCILEALAATRSLSMPDLKEEQLNDKVVNEEYKIWKKHSPFLYDVCLVKALERPSPSLDWVKDPRPEQERDFITSSLILGTCASDEDTTNYIYKALVDLPESNDAESTKLHNLLETGQKIAHDGPVVIVKSSPANPSLVATFTRNGNVNVYDTAQFPTSQPAQEVSPAKPTKTLKFHSREGTSLAWHPTDPNCLASTALDGSLVLWDLSQTEPLKTWTTQTYYNEVAFSDDNLLGAISNDGHVNLYDLTDLQKNPWGLQAHDLPGHTIDFNKVDPLMFATGSADGFINIWKLQGRNPLIQTIEAHSQQVRTVRWSPSEKTVLASGGDDRRAKIWDTSMKLNELSSSEQLEGPPELIFVHGGHVARINCLEWHPTQQWTIASTSEDNVVQIWSPASAIVNSLE